MIIVIQCEQFIYLWTGIYDRCDLINNTDRNLYEFSLSYIMLLDRGLGFNLISSNRTNANIEPGLTLLNEWGFRNRVPYFRNGANIKVYFEILNATYGSFGCWDMLEVMKNLLLLSSSRHCTLHYPVSKVHRSSSLLIMTYELHICSQNYLRDERSITQIWTHKCPRQSSAGKFVAGFHWTQIL